MSLSLAICKLGLSYLLGFSKVLTVIQHEYVIRTFYDVLSLMLLLRGDIIYVFQEILVDEEILLTPTISRHINKEQIILLRFFLI